MNNTPIPRWQQIIYIVTPFFLLLFGLITFNVLTRDDAVVVAGAETAVFQPTPTPIATSTMTPIPTPVPTSRPPTATPYNAPVYDAETAVVLLGPPDETLLRLQDLAVFYWDWPLPLSDDQQFTLYIQHDGQTTAIASLNEPNLGTTYRATLHLNDLLTEATTIQWQIRLESSFADAPLTASEIRTITVLP